ncbi:hypothetical protein IV203_005186 [Nitzschia inconspicua]|uniref:Uncharacterized protein n=1 Tax=Nitzschia inconspicua TaxID=303405 RepID=A0A9K3KLW0_9STRA|nr:hypothetical protein IV203_005186 [Nitzschia inconspicua]
METGQQTFTDSQVIPLALLPIFPGILSVLSSLLILSSIRRKRSIQQCRDRKRPHANQNKLGTYERLLVGMSVFDVISTTTFIWSPFLAPSGYWWPSKHPFGNANTCRFAGTMVQLSLANMYYYGCLGIYFLLTIRFHMRQETITNRVEPWMHLSSISLATIPALVGAVIDFYGVNEFFPGCWIDDYPKGCAEDECLSPLIAWVCAGLPFMSVIVVLVVSNLTISYYVRRRYGLHVHSNTGENNNDNSTSRPFSTKHSASFHLGGSSLFLGHSTEATESSTQHKFTPTSTKRSFLASMRRSTSMNDSTLSTSPNLSGSLHPVGQANRVRLVSSQASLYVGTFFLTYSWFFVLQIVESLDADSRASFPTYPFMILQAFFTPMAGFWNALIFFRPKYIALRQYHLRRHQRQLERKRQPTVDPLASQGSAERTPDNEVIKILSRWEIIILVLFGERRGVVREPNFQVSEGNPVSQRTRFCPDTTFGIERISVISALKHSPARNNMEEYDEESPEFLQQSDIAIDPFDNTDNEIIKCPSPLHQVITEAPRSTRLDEGGIIGVLEKTKIFSDRWHSNIDRQQN